MASISNNGVVTQYTYDANNNISTITSGGKAIAYTYNSLDELVREDNQVLNKTIVYSYDAGGNILSKTEYPYTTSTTLGTATNTITYTYGDSTWKDKLTSYNGNAITYDAAGNTLTYNGYSFTWEVGHQLSAISGNGKNISYKYNNYGYRTEKTVHGITSKYYLDGDKVVLENTGNGSIYYSYDADDKLVSMTLNGTEYFYIRNGQGDITGFIDTAGTQVVSYTYDGWGKLISIDGTLKDTVGLKNPYRYRGYRYDTETSLYYLQSRYYDPEMGRYINADDVEFLGATGTLLSHNLFAYCENNPVNNSDPSGYFAFTLLIKGIVGAIFGGISQYISDLINKLIYPSSKYSSVGTYILSMVNGAVDALWNAGIFKYLAAYVGTNLITQAVNFIIYKTAFNWGSLLSALIAAVVDYGLSKLAIKSPKYIRDIKKMAVEKGLKGTRALTSFLNNQIFKIEIANICISSLTSQVKTLGQSFYNFFIKPIPCY